MKQRHKSMITIPCVDYNNIKESGTVSYCTFGDNLKMLRKSRKLTQKGLGDKVGLSKAVVSKYETGIGYPSFEVLIRIAQFFGVSTDYLLGIPRGKSIDVSQLTDRQVEILRQLISEFNIANQK